MAHDVFISYSSKDKPTADAVCATLEANAIRCWIAPRDIMPGSDWGEALVSAIKGARVMVLVFSAQANFSPQIKREVERAVSAGIPIIPLRIEDVAPSASLEYFISTPHWLDAFTPPLERHLQYLTEVIQKMLGLRPSDIDTSAPIDAPETAVPENFAPEQATGYKSKLVWASVLLILAALGLGGWWLVHQTQKTPQGSSIAILDGSTNAVTNSGTTKTELTDGSIALPANRNDQAESWRFTTIAGQAGMRGMTDGVGSDARFNTPDSVAVDKEGNIFVFDRVNLKIRRINPSGAVTTFASLDASIDARGNARFIGIAKVALDGIGNLYLTDGGKNEVMKITPSGTVATFAGLAGVTGSNDGPAALARFEGPGAITMAPNGSIFVGDHHGRLIRKIAPNGMVSTVAGQDGSLQTTYSRRGGNLAAGPVFDLAVGAHGMLYIAYLNAIRVLNPDGTISTFTGQPEIAGDTDGTATNARFNLPRGICADSEGNFYVVDSGNNTVRKINNVGVVTTIGGLDNVAGSADGTGAHARFCNPWGITMDARGDLYVADTFNNTIRKGHRQTTTISQTH